MKKTCFNYLLKISVKLPPQRRLRNRPSAQGLPSHSSRPPVIMPGTKTTGWRAVKPSRLSLTAGNSGTWSNVTGKQWYNNKRSHQVVQRYPIIQQQESKHLHSLDCLLGCFLFLLISKAKLLAEMTSSFLSSFWSIFDDWSKDSNPTEEHLTAGST